MSYLQYINFYTKNKSNYGGFTKRGRKDNHWLNSVKVNDKLDIFDGNQNGDQCWHIGTVLDIIKTNKSIKLYVHYDGWEAIWDEWVHIDYSITISMKLKSLHTFTPKHLYLIDKSYDECQWLSDDSSWRKCDICNIKCCTQCFIIMDNQTDQYLCKHCIELLDHKRIFIAIYIAIADQYRIDINIIYLLTDYAMGYILKCCNRSKQRQCPNPIFFPSRFPLEIAASGESYHYITNISSANTEYIFGRNLRIFCEFCTRNCLRPCSICSDTNDVLPICYKHPYRIAVVYGGKGTKCDILTENALPCHKDLALSQSILNEQDWSVNINEKKVIIDRYTKNKKSKRKQKRKVWKKEYA